jgi:hypothetical protein
VTTFVAIRTLNTASIRRSRLKRIRNKFCDIDPTFAEIENYQAFGYCGG